MQPTSSTPSQPVASIDPVHVSDSPTTRRQVPLWVSGILAALASGGLMACGYWPMHFHFLAWVAMIPWLIMLPRLTSANAWVFGTLLGLMFYRVGLHWLYGVNPPMGGILIVESGILMGFSFRVAWMLTDRFGLWSMIWTIPLCFTGQEILRCEALGRYRFSFLALGYSQSANLWLAQIASVGGVYFVTFLIVLFNSACAFAILRRKIRFAAIPAAVGIVILALAVSSQPPSYEHLPKVPVACVQADTFVFDEYVKLTTQALSDPLKPALVVLPEHTIEPYARDDHPLMCDLTALATKHKAYVCLGADYPAKKGSACDFDNLAVVIGPDGKIISRQAKAIPIPFFKDGNPATSQTTTDTPWGTIGTCVCYDGMFTDIPRRLVDRGAELLLVPVMDVQAWPLQERWQHADMAVFRSIELRRCAVRGASAGISQIIDATGRVLKVRKKEQGAGTLCGHVYFTDDKTLFVRGGYLFAPFTAYAFLIAVVVLTLLDWWTKYRRRRSSSHVCSTTTTAG